MVASECSKCGSPNQPYLMVRERNVDLVLVDGVCLDCGFSWSKVMKSVEYVELLAMYEREAIEAFKRR